MASIEDFTPVPCGGLSLEARQKCLNIPHERNERRHPPCARIVIGPSGRRPIIANSALSLPACRSFLGSRSRRFDPARSGGAAEPLGFRDHQRFFALRLMVVADEV